jgi:hypothetical protein
MNTLERIADPDETVVPAFEGLALIPALAFLAALAYFEIRPSNWIVLFHWRWLTAIQIGFVIYACLRAFRWSPIYAGPTIVIRPEDLAGRGGWDQAPWRLRWDEIDHFESGRGALKIFRKGLPNWHGPILQRGVGSPSLVRQLHERMRVQEARRQSSESGSPG